MKGFTLLVSLALTGGVLGAVETTDAGGLCPANPLPYVSLFKTPLIGDSAGGKSTCVSGFIALPVMANVTRYEYTVPEGNQAAITETILEVLQSRNPTLVRNITRGTRTLVGKYNIYGRLCFPKNSSRGIRTLQITTHGNTLNNRYWDQAPGGFSYVDSATAAGYAVLTYDQIGVGRSDKPDPVQDTQAGSQAGVLHALGQLFRGGGNGSSGSSDTVTAAAPCSFAKVVAVGHSYGSVAAIVNAVSYPKDFDALVLTGISTFFGTVQTSDQELSLQIAARSGLARFATLPSGYLTPSTPIGFQSSFYRYPNYPQTLFDAAYDGRDVVSLGLFFSLGTLPTVPGYTGPVDVVDGRFDLPLCGSDCLLPTNLPAQVQPAVFPNARGRSMYYIVPGSGHCIQGHYGASSSDAHIMGFLSTNGL